jgi:hypothetical protein
MEMSLLLQFKQFLGACNFHYLSQKQEAYCCYKLLNEFPAKNGENCQPSAMNANELLLSVLCSLRSLSQVLKCPHFEILTSMLQIILNIKRSQAPMFLSYIF